MAVSSLFIKSNTDQIFLRQGMTVKLAAHEKIEVFTPLGSCVSCIIFHPDRGSIITHAKFPWQESFENAPGEIVDVSTRSAIEHFERSDLPKKDWKVMLFGGGIIHYHPGEHYVYSGLGWQNIISALPVLQEKKLQLSVANFGGFGGRRLRFWNESGRVVCERIKGSYGGILVNSKTPAWLLLESMHKRLRKIRDLTPGDKLDDAFEEFPPKW